MTTRHLVYPDRAYRRKRPKTDVFGNPICINCGKFLPKRRILYCSDACNIAFYRKHVKDWSIIREEVFKRDNYRCQDCGAKLSLSEAECDHIIPLFLGGKEFDINNLQTLCKDCHKNKTAKERGRYGKLEVEIQMGTQQTLVDLQFLNKNSKGKQI